jgi:hypothetical protein
MFSAGVGGRIEINQKKKRASGYSRPFPDSLCKIPL